jgi:hypothetical protein
MKVSASSAHSGMCSWIRQSSQRVIKLEALSAGQSGTFRYRDRWLHRGHRNHTRFQSVSVSLIEMPLTRRFSLCAANSYVFPLRRRITVLPHATVNPVAGHGSELRRSRKRTSMTHATSNR